MINLFNDKSECYGCGVCANSCPQNAILMEEDKQGFKYPLINEELCIECGLCKKVCQINKESFGKNNRSEFCYGIKASDDIRKVSSSGGIYTVLSDFFLNNGGVCVGVKYDNKLNSVFCIATTKTERNEFRGSKYSQGELKDIFILIKKYLCEKTPVLFVGTPCQVNALKLFLKNGSIDDNILYTIDLVCHGVASPLVWKQYIKHIQDKYESNIIEFTFRNKLKGWRGYHVFVKLENNNVLTENDCVQSFAKLYSKNLMLRPSCYNCKYSSLERTGDISIGDFWGIEKIDSSFSDNIGISLVLVNTEKGEKLFNQNYDKITLKKYDVDVINQPNLYEPSKKSVHYNSFWKAFYKYGYKCVARKYGGYGKLQILYRTRDYLCYKLLKKQ